MIKKQKAFLLLLFFVFTNSKAQNIAIGDDFPVGKITIKFSENTSIRKVAVEPSPITSQSSSKEETPSQNENSASFIFMSDLLDPPQNLPPPSPSSDSISLEQLKDGLASFNKMIVDFEINPIKTFSAQSDETLTKLRKDAERNSNKRIDDLNLFYDIYYDEKVLYKDVKALVQSLGEIEIIDAVEPSAPPSELLPPTTPNFESNQTYLPKPVFGSLTEDAVGATAAWKIPGGAGAGVKIIDIEYNWNPSHEDYPTLFYNSGNFLDQDFDGNHGDAVVGILAAKRNGIGVTGISYDAQIGIMSTNASGSFNIAQSILLSVQLLDPGDIILIEQQSLLPEEAQNSSCRPIPSFGPVEWNSAIFSAIETAVGNDIIVVEAGGNGGLDLDHPALMGKFDRNTRDSGAILVGASTAPFTINFNGAPVIRRSPACYTPHGDRIDSHARASGVTSLGYGSLYDGGSGALYTDRFGGTSSASPIVTASAAAIQGMLKAAGRPILKPAEIRQLLTSTGLPQTRGFERYIATNPDIMKAAKALDLIDVNLTPLYYLLLLEENL